MRNVLLLCVAVEGRQVPSIGAKYEPTAAGPFLCVVARTTVGYCGVIYYCTVVLSTNVQCHQAMTQPPGMAKWRMPEFDVSTTGGT